LLLLLGADRARDPPERAKVANEPDTGLVGPLPVLANLFYKA
jgi:hypothetical protein